MKVKAIASIILIITVVGGIYIYAIKDNNTDTKSSQLSAAPAVSEPIARKRTSHIQPGAYIDYSDGIIAKTSGTKVLFFHAPWCPQCQALDKNIKSITIPDDVTIIKVDYDTQNDLRVKYSVTLQTTLVKISNDGELIKKFVAYSEPTFQSIKTNLLD